MLQFTTDTFTIFQNKYKYSVPKMSSDTLSQFNFQDSAYGYKGLSCTLVAGMDLKRRNIFLKL